jgi:hypothetical protein
MKLIYTKEEVMQIMKSHVADLIDVEVTFLAQNNYGEDFITICCTKIDKPKRASRWIKDESYRDPRPSSEETNRLFSAHDALRTTAPAAPELD